MNKFIDSSGEIVVFCTPENNSSYWKIKIDESYGNKTVFTSHHGSYRVTSTLFGPENLPATLKRAMVAALAPVRWKFSPVYFEDKVDFLKSPLDLIEEARRILRLLQKIEVTLNMQKCKLFAEKNDYLSHFILPGRFELAEHTTVTVAKMEHPTA